VDEEQGIYRGEVLAIMGAIADVKRIRVVLGDEEDDDGEAEEADA
jgi:hypothetical protein